MTPDDQAWMDRVDGALLALADRAPAVHRLRSIPMDMLAVAVMRQLARDGAEMPFSSQAIDRAILEIEDRNRGSV